MKKCEPLRLSTAARTALDQNRIIAIGVKYMTTGLATKAVGQNRIDRCADHRTCRTAGCTSDEAAQDGAGDYTQWITAVFCVGNRAGSSLDSAGDATDGGCCGLRAASTNDERGVTTRTREGHGRANPSAGVRVTFRLPPLPTT